jgi:hypothetical protein
VQIHSGCRFNSFRTMQVLRYGPVFQQRVTPHREEDLAPVAAVRTRSAEEAALTDKMAMAATMETAPATGGISPLLAIRMGTRRVMALRPLRITLHPITHRPIILRMPLRTRLQTLRRMILRTPLRRVLPIIHPICHQTSRTVGRIVRLRHMLAIGLGSAGGGRFVFDQEIGMDIPMKRTV